MSWFGNVLGFEGFNAKKMLGQIKDNPARLLYGSADPFSTKAWNGILGTHDKPIIDQMGGATPEAYQQAQAAGINTGPGKSVHDLAHVIAGAEAGGYGLDSLGGVSAASGGSGLPSTFELGGSGSGGFGMGGDALTAGGSGGAGGTFDMGGLFGSGSGGSGAAAGGMDWGKLLQNGIKVFGQGGGSSNDAALRRQEALAELLRRNYEQQQQSAQQMPGWVNMSGG